MSFKKEVLESLCQIKATQAEQHATLKDHIRRTEILEKAISPSRILGLLAAVAAILEALHRVFK